MENSCDIGPPRSTLDTKFPQLEFEDLPEHWWYIHGKSQEESWQNLLDHNGKVSDELFLTNNAVSLGIIFSIFGK